MNRSRQGRFSLVAVSVAVTITGTALVAVGKEESDASQLFKQAIALAEKHEIRKAIKVMERAREIVPANANILWNLGIWYSELEDQVQALSIWKEYRELEPDDWRGRAKLIQTYQALDEHDLRDRERLALYDARRSAGDSELGRIDKYCREQLSVGKTRVMVFEYFDPAGERMVLLRFSVLNEQGEEGYWYSLGSYDTTTQIARELGEIDADERVYHLDQYAEGYHATYGFFRGLPNYDDVRDRVMSALKGDLKPLSSTTTKQ